MTLLTFNVDSVNTNMLASGSMGRRAGRAAPGKKAAGDAGRGRRGSYHHGDLRRALIQAAVDLMARAGVDALTLRAAARRAGVSAAAPYRHFADKQALLAAVAEEGFRAMVEEMRRASAEHSTEPLAALRAVGLAYVGFARRHPSHFRVMFGREVADRSRHPALSEAAAAAFELLADAVGQCQRAGLVREGDPRALAVSAWSMVHGLADLQVNRQLAIDARSPETLANDVTADLFLGLGSRAA